MSADLHQRAKPIFLAASQLTSEQAQAFLGLACGDDAELRREVESLLANYDSATLFGRPSQSDTTINALRTGELFDTLSSPQEDVHERAVGTIVAGRYRLLGLLGRGGMGAVYRAADLELGEDIAIKFIHRNRAQGEALARRARDEVRLARLVTHPNVTRIHDIGEDDGQTFITMEFVGGEDLAALLRRMGRLSSEKAVNVARQLCFGLGAAHDKGVLHRDLKPANVMLDATGQVRIMDFGIAGFAEDLGRRPDMAGTPFYMAPELFGRAGPSVQSDLYALGLVLYEAVTATPFDGQRDETFSSVMNLDSAAAALGGIDASLVAAIDQCLQAEPRLRPGSAYEVAAMLPGGDPIAAAMRRGDAPSPSLIAAAGDRRGLSPRTALGLWAACLIGLALVALLADRTFLFSQSPLPKAPAVLRDRAETIVERLGYRHNAATSCDGLEWTDRKWVSRRASTRTDETTVMPLEPVISYWYRSGDPRWQSPPAVGQRTSLRSRSPSQGVLTISLDPTGSLRKFSAHGYEHDHDRQSTVASGDLNWTELFSLAGLDFAQFRLTAERIAPPPTGSLLLHEGVYVWESKNLPADSTVTVRATIGQGALRDFAVQPPDLSSGESAAGDASVASAPGSDAESGGSRSLMSVVLSGLYVALTAVAALMIRHNFRRGRIDAAGTGRVAATVGCGSMLAWALASRHVWIADAALVAFWQWASWSCAFAAMVGLWYAAIEFYARKLWPHRLTAWSRVLRGNVADAVVARDALVGTVAGVLLVLLFQIDVLAAREIEPTRPFAVLPRGDVVLSEFLGFRRDLGIVLGAALDAIVLSMGVLLLSLVAHVALRDARRASVATWITLALLLTLAAYEQRPFPLLSGVPRAAAIVWLATRFGLLATIVSFFTSEVILTSPLTLDSSAWYAAHGALALLIVASIATWAWWVIRASRPLLSRKLFDLR